VSLRHFLVAALLSFARKYRSATGSQAVKTLKNLIKAFRFTLSVGQGSRHESYFSWMSKEARKTRQVASLPKKCVVRRLLIQKAHHRLIAMLEQERLHLTPDLRAVMGILAEFCLNDFDNIRALAIDLTFAIFGICPPAERFVRDLICQELVAAEPKEHLIKGAVSFLHGSVTRGTVRRSYTVMAQVFNCITHCQRVTKDGIIQASLHRLFISLLEDLSYPTLKVEPVNVNSVAQFGFGKLFVVALLRHVARGLTGTLCRCCLY